MELEPGLRCLRAPNPSPMTYWGTNTYILGHRNVAIIDPGPDNSGHLAAILEACAGATVKAILVTHSHLDHSPLARPLAAATGAPVLAAGPSDWGRAPAMAALARDGALGGGEGVDHAFKPDAQLRDGAVIDGNEWSLVALSTPGHMANHMSFAWQDALFSGDLVMGWATSVVSPPDGDMTAFYASLERLMHRRDRVYYPGHGAPVTAPLDRARALYDHRRSREAAIETALADGPADAKSLTARIYTDVDPQLRPMAERNVLAHLIDLSARNAATYAPPLTASSRFTRVEN
ncbi:MAG: MBL fold metallo-hydrolase [Pseudomonadota bacterium]